MTTNPKPESQPEAVRTLKGNALDAIERSPSPLSLDRNAVESRDIHKPYGRSQADTQMVKGPSPAGLKENINTNQVTYLRLRVDLSKPGQIWPSLTMLPRYPRYYVGAT
jgi:hypothetical protein